MAQKNATPTREQGRIIELNGLNKAHWVVVKELSEKMIITNRFSHEFRTISKTPEELQVADILDPDPDGQFRLRGCSCGSPTVAYLQLVEGSWAVRCMRCKKTSPPFPVRHDAQIHWNTKMADLPPDRRG